MIDLSHAGERTALDTIEHSTDPVVFSHSNAKAIRDNPRNLTDEQIRACAATGGVVGIATFADFVGETAGGRRPTLEEYFRHIDYVARLGRLAERQTISTLPSGFAGSNFCSESLVSAEGRLVESGSFDELLRRGGAFADMAARQGIFAGGSPQATVTR